MLIDVTSYIIDDVNNFITEEQCINEDLKVLKQSQLYHLYVNESHVLVTPSVTEVVEFILQNFIHDMEGK